MIVATQNRNLGVFDCSADVGSTSTPGASTYDAVQQTYSVSGAGHNIWSDKDAFHFIWTPIRGNFIVTAHGSFVGEGVNAHRKYGWMARAALDANAAHVSTGIHGDGLLSLQYRRSSGYETEEVRAPLEGADVFQR